MITPSVQHEPLHDEAVPNDSAAAEPSTTLLHSTPSLSILHKPAGMPISGNKPLTVLNSPILQNTTPTVIAAVPRPMSGPAILAFTATTASSLTTLYQSAGIHFTFSAIVHCPSDALPTLRGATVTHERTIPSTTGPLSSLLITTTASGHGLRKQLRRCGTPAVGTVADTRTTRCTTRGLFVACTRLCIPALGIDLALSRPRKFDTLLQREERFGRARMERTAARTRQGDDGVPRVRFLDCFFCVAGAMTPRESTEIVAHTAAEYLKRAARHPPRVLDLGTGCGAILIAAILRAGVNATGVGVEISPDAARVARRNVGEHGLMDVDIIEGDFGELQGVGLFDVVVSNPPYLTKLEVRKDECFFKDEPEGALLAGADGMDGYRAIAKSVGDVLVEGGVLVLEIGCSRDAAAVRAMFEGLGLDFMDLIADFRGFKRCLILRKPR